MDDRAFWLAIRRALLTAAADEWLRSRPRLAQAVAMVASAIESRYNVGEGSTKKTA